MVHRCSPSPHIFIFREEFVPREIDSPPVKYDRILKGLSPIHNARIYILLKTHVANNSGGPSSMLRITQESNHGHEDLPKQLFLC